MVSCGAEAPCHEAAESRDCADLLFKGVGYDEWRVVDLRRLPQELGDATYPACNSAGTCDDRGLGGNGSTDVWLAKGVQPAQAVVGLREGTRTTVVFVALDADPEDVASRLDPRLLR